MNLRLPIALMLAAVMAFAVAACGDDEESGNTASGASTEQSAEPVAQIDNLTGRTTAVALDSGFVSALESLELTPAPVGDAEITEEGRAIFPITGGNVTYYEPGTVSPFVQGEILHEGSGLSLSSGDTTVELTDFVVDPGASVLTGTVSANGEVAAESAPLFFLDGRTLNPLQVNESDGTAVLEGTTVKLKEEAAQLLNETFGTDALEAGLVIGVAEITVNV